MREATPTAADRPAPVAANRRSDARITVAAALASALTAASPSLITIAVISAVLTATFVIGAGQALLRGSEPIILPRATVVSHASAD